MQDTLILNARIHLSQKASSLLSQIAEVSASLAEIEKNISGS